MDSMAPSMPEGLVSRPLDTGACERERLRLVGLIPSGGHVPCPFPASRLPPSRSAAAPYSLAACGEIPCAYHRRTPLSRRRQRFRFPKDQQQPRPHKRHPVGIHAHRSPPLDAGHPAGVPSRDGRSRPPVPCEPPPTSHTIPPSPPLPLFNVYAISGRYVKNTRNEEALASAAQLLARAGLTW